MKARYRIPMKFKDGDGGRKMREEFKGKSTIELIAEGYRTATTRDMTKYYNRIPVKVGDIVEFYNNEHSVYVVITKEPYSITEIDKEEWSLLECWDTSVYDRLNKNYQQYQFQLWIQ